MSYCFPGPQTFSGRGSRVNHYTISNKGTLGLLYVEYRVRFWFKLMVGSIPFYVITIGATWLCFTCRWLCQLSLKGKVLVALVQV